VSDRNSVGPEKTRSCIDTADAAPNNCLQPMISQRQEHTLQAYNPLGHATSALRKLRASSILSGSPAIRTRFHLALVPL
jgi:hypothetical protein